MTKRKKSSPAGTKLARKAAEHTIGLRPVGYLEIVHGRIQVKSPRKTIA